MKKKKQATGFKNVSQTILQRNKSMVGQGSNAPYYISNAVERYKLPSGENRAGVDNKVKLRVLPPIKEDDYAFRVTAHRYLGPDNGYYLCLQKMFGERCPLCEAYMAAQEAGLGELAQKLRAKERVLMYVLDLKAKKPTEKVYLLDAPVSLADDILTEASDEDTGELLNISHPKRGVAISFMVQKKRGSSYPEYKRIRIGDRFPIPESLAEKMFSFEEVLVKPEASELKQIARYYKAQMKNLDEDADDDALEEEERSIAKKKKKKKKKSRFADDLPL